MSHVKKRIVVRINQDNSCETIKFSEIQKGDQYILLEPDTMEVVDNTVWESLEDSMIRPEHNDYYAESKALKEFKKSNSQYGSSDVVVAKQTMGFENP